MKPVSVLITCAVLALASSLPAQNTFSSVSTEAEQRLQASLEELRELRAQIAREKIPVARQISQLEDKVLKARRELDRLQSVRDTRSTDLAGLQRRVEALQEQQTYVSSLLNELSTNFEGRLHISELPAYEATTKAAKYAPSNADLSKQQQLSTQLEVVKKALERMAKASGGHTYSGEAVASGDVLAGTFMALGPTVYFAADNGQAAGIAEAQINAADAAVVDIGEGYTAMITETVQAAEGPLPLDASLGKAIKVAQNRKSLLEYTEDGGAVGYVIIGLGLVSLLIGLFKAFEVITFPTPSTKDLDETIELTRSGNKNAAIERAEKVSGPGGRMLVIGVEHAGEKRGVLEELLFERVLAVRPKLERLLPFLAITAATAPLLGLLGTVIGMIKTFSLITLFGTGDAKSLSGGISEALVTTALGLIVAIPILILHGILARMAKAKVGTMEQIVVGFVNGISVRGVAQPATPRPAKAVPLTSEPAPEA
jgi:biopolymer transport protein ExbB